MIVHSLVIQASLTGILKKSAMMATSRSPADSAADSQYPSGFFFGALRVLGDGSPFRSCDHLIPGVLFQFALVQVSSAACTSLRDCGVLAKRIRRGEEFHARLNR